MTEEEGEHEVGGMRPVLGEMPSQGKRNLATTTRAGGTIWNVIEGRVKPWVPYMGLAFLIFCGTGLPNIAVGFVQYPVKVECLKS